MNTNNYIRTIGFTYFFGLTRQAHMSEISRSGRKVDDDPFLGETVFPKIHRIQK